MNRLARALVPVAHRALALPPCASPADGPSLGAALDAIDAFLAEPIGSRYLAASRALVRLTTLRLRSAELGKLARRSIEAELDTLAARGLGDTQALETLRGLPDDPRAGRRLAALAALLDAHREIAARVRAPERLRAKLGLVHVPGRRKQTDRRGPRRR